MIYLFTGVPGSGKSLHVAMTVHEAVWAGRNVIANFEVDEAYFSGAKHPERLGAFIHAPVREWTSSSYRCGAPPGRYSFLDGLYSFARQFHVRDARGRVLEGQTLLVLDECHEIFNCREWARKDRLPWCAFLREHRKYGFDVYLVTQEDRVVDKQIRALVQYQVAHRSVARHGVAGRLLAMPFGGHLFSWVQSDYHVRGDAGRLASGFFSGRRYFDFYDTCGTFHGG